MEVKIEEKPDCVVLHLRGKLFGGPFAAELNKILHKLLDEGKKKFILNLDGVTVLNSSGFGVLVACYTTIKNDGGKLKFAGVSRNIERLFSITKLNRIFERHLTVEEAQKSF